MPVLICFLLLVFFKSTPAVAIESRSQREAVATVRSKKFYRGNRAKQYLSLTGQYSSDNNSRHYDANMRYLYQSSKNIHEVNFNHEVNYNDVGSGKKKLYDVKTSELYDIALASKMRFFSTPIYLVAYHRTIYDDMSSFYYDNRSAGGVGVIFFKDKIEIDISAANHDIKNEGQEKDYIASYRLNHNFLENFTINQRGFLYFDRNSLDCELRSSVIYRYNHKFSFEIRHNFENRRYKTAPNKLPINNVSRSISFGMVFDLGNWD